MFLYLFTSTGWKFICTVCSTVMQTKRIPEWHYAILTTFIKLPFVIKNFVLSILSGHFAQVLLYIDVTQLVHIAIPTTMYTIGFFLFLPLYGAF